MSTINTGTGFHTNIITVKDVFSCAIFVEVSSQMFLLLKPPKKVEIIIFCVYFFQIGSRKIFNHLLRVLSIDDNNFFICIFKEKWTKVVPVQNVFSRYKNLLYWNSQLTSRVDYGFFASIRILIYFVRISEQILILHTESSRCLRTLQYPCLRFFRGSLCHNSTAVGTGYNFLVYHTFFHRWQNYLHICLVINFVTSLDFGLWTNIYIRKTLLNVFFKGCF